MASYSSLGASARRGRSAAYDDVDRSIYALGSTLASIVNDPRLTSTSSSFWGLGSSADAEPPPPPPLDPTRYPPVSRADLQGYVNLVHGTYERFERDCQALDALQTTHEPDGGLGHAEVPPGEPMLVALRAVPAHFFAEDFLTGWDDFFRQFCQDQSADELSDVIDGLNKNLDVVELQLLREVAGRSESFFRTAEGTQELLAQLSSSAACVRSLRASLATADEQLCSTAARVTALQARRRNLAAVLDISSGLEEVVAAQAALQCMRQAQDHAGSLELLGQLTSLLEQQPALRGLQCVRHLPPLLVDAGAAAERALTDDFLNAAAHSNAARIVADAVADANAEPDAGIASDSSAQEGSRWTLAALDSRAAGAATAEQLHDTLLPLTLALHRCDRLGAALQLLRTRAGDDTRAAMRDGVAVVLPLLLQASAGETTTGAPDSSDGVGLTMQLQTLHHGAFMLLLHACARLLCAAMQHMLAVGQQVEAILAAAHATPGQLASVRREAAAALQSVVDAGLGRWVKLLGCRADAHARLKQYELRQLLDLSEQVAARAEALGARPPASFRAALSGACRALLEHSHSRAMDQLQHLLEGEQWVPVEVPGEFQDLVDRLVARCGAGAAALASGGGASSSSSSSIGHKQQVAQATAPPPAASGGTGTGVGSAGERLSPVLQLCGRHYHQVNSGLMLLRALEQYLALAELMPAFAAEVVHRLLELLRLFNATTAALVLGAGAMRTAGLRSISAKQLALSAQAVGTLGTLVPLLRTGCLAPVSQPRRALLIPEFDRLAADLQLHVDEVHAKLVDIMRDRLAAALAALPGEAATVVASSSGSSGGTPLPAVALLARQLGTLRGVLVPLLLREEVEYVFGAVTRAYSDGLAAAFDELLVADGGAALDVPVRNSALTMLQAFRDLPLEPARAGAYWTRLSTCYTKHFGLPPWDQERLGARATPTHTSEQAEHTAHIDASGAGEPLQRSAVQPLQGQQAHAGGVPATAPEQQLQPGMEEEQTEQQPQQTEVWQQEQQQPPLHHTVNDATQVQVVAQHSSVDADGVSAVCNVQQTLPAPAVQQQEQQPSGQLHCDEPQLVADQQLLQQHQQQELQQHQQQQQQELQQHQQQQQQELQHGTQPGFIDARLTAASSPELLTTTSRWADGQTTAALTDEIISVAASSSRLAADAPQDAGAPDAAQGDALPFEQVLLTGLPGDDGAAASSSEWPDESSISRYCGEESTSHPAHEAAAVADADVSVPPTSEVALDPLGATSSTALPAAFAE